MPDFTSYFIAVPLPEDLKTKYADLLKKVASEHPELETAYVETPHITVYYLTKDADLVRAQEQLTEISGFFKGLELEVGGWDFFRPGNPRVVILSVKYPTEFSKINQNLSERLADFSAEDNLRKFHPHVTVSRIKNPADFSIEKIVKSLPQISWTFPITEVAIFGADSKQNPEYQQKLVSISI